jgi:peptidoglycan/xylan/chitin deacetylase (PgdA/CDA1 family)
LLCGYRLEIYPELAQQIFDAGHEIGLHGYSHKSMQDMCANQVVREFEETMALIPAGCPVAFLRSPGGLCGKCVQTVAGDMGLAVLSWSVDPKDWAIHNTAAIEKAVLDKVRDGDIILLHDMSDSSVKAALDIVDVLQGRGYRFVTASELARIRKVRLKPGKIYKSFSLQEEEKIK